ncbi:MAG: hypothetical protein IPO15_11575 [Anaerolineae bacterium]|uniref:hypothetical protein n=1 Tax=Candidatus Amarolinea dominans TaxID=3140696 RepID=UPI003134B13A|nr:hypothetical protein [Anaerolineae bacterium]
MNQADVVDFSLAEPDLPSIIKQIYSGALTEAAMPSSPHWQFLKSKWRVYGALGRHGAETLPGLSHLGLMEFIGQIVAMTIFVYLARCIRTPTPPAASA